MNILINTSVPVKKVFAKHVLLSASHWWIVLVFLPAMIMILLYNDPYIPNFTKLEYFILLIVHGFEIRFDLLRWNIQFLRSRSRRCFIFIKRFHCQNVHHWICLPFCFTVIFLGDINFYALPILPHLYQLLSSQFCFDLCTIQVVLWVDQSCICFVWFEFWWMCGGILFSFLDLSLDYKSVPYGES